MLDHYNNNTKEQGMQSLILEAGNEYFIQVYPNGVVTSENYKSLTFDHRQCKLKDEIEKSSVFKIYTKGWIMCKSIGSLSQLET